MAWASGTLIPAPSRVDHIHDTKRSFLYISSGDSVLRYNLATRALAAPIRLGGDLAGMDLSPDGDTLAIANRTANSAASTNSIFLVNLVDGTSRTINFPLDGSSEGGTFSVAYGSDGQILVSSRFNGSGAVPLRRFNPATNETTILSRLNQDSMLCASGDRSVIGIAESNSSGGPWGSYRVSDGTLVKSNNGTSAFNYEIGVNSSGTQFSIPTYIGTYVYNSSYQKIATLGAYAGAQPIGAAYHPSEPIIYFPWAQTSEVRVYSANTLQQIGAYNFETTFSSNGNHGFESGRAKVSRDGSLLEVSVDGGVRFVSIRPLQALPQSVVVSQESSVAITLSAENIDLALPVTFTVTSPPTRGSLSGSGASLVYTPQSGSNGTDSFVFRVSNKGEVSEARVSIDIVDKNGPALKVTTPPDGAVINSLPRIEGTVADNLGGSGVASVEFSLQRVSDGKFWSSVQWEDSTSLQSMLPTTLDNQTWSSGSVTLPSSTATDPAKQLTEGAYVISVVARDQSGNTSTSSSNFTVDTTAPTNLTISAPLNGAFVTALPLVEGTAVDNEGGSGISRVELFFKRNKDGLYWNGSAWGTAPVALSTTLQGGTWSKTSDLPLTNTTDPAKKLLDGSYLLTATAYDQAGSQKSVSSAFTLDKLNPAVTITTPANQTFVTSLLTISGTAIDSEGGSGIARLDVLLKRNVDGKYWNGSAWGNTTPVVLKAGLNNGKWGITSANLPSTTATDTAKRLTEGTYLVTATAFDKANNQKSIGSFFTVDRTNPAVSITNPLNRTFVTSLSSVTGTATDNAGGSGIARVDVFLKRNADGKYWTGSAWGTATAVALPVGLNNGKWGRSSSGLPSTTATDINKRLTLGDYTLYATAYDKANNQKSTSNFFTVKAASSTATSALWASAASAPSASVSAPSVVLSKAWASPGSASATLAFSGALDVASATDEARYMVRINGVIFAVDSISSTNGGTGVILVLGEGALRIGDKVEVKYDLLDASRRALSGSVTLASDAPAPSASSS